MSVENEVNQRAGHKCELCGSEEDLTLYAVEPNDGTADQSLLLCNSCLSQVTGKAEIDPNHWYCLNEAIWSPVPAVQVLAYRMAYQLKDSQSWVMDLLDMVYLEDDLKAWAEAGLASEEDKEDIVIQKDSNGNPLEEGDSVTLIKDLEVKGAGFTAKRGTLVKNIHLTEQPGFIEGKVNGTQIVLKTEFLKKA